MNCKRRREPRTTQLPDDVYDACVVSSLPDEATKVRGMKLPVGAWCRPDLVMKLLHLGIFFGQRFWLRCRCWSRA